METTTQQGLNSWRVIPKRAQIISRTNQCHQ